MNGEYVRRTPIKELHEPCLKAVQEKGLGDGIRSDEWFDKVIELYQERFRTFPEFADKTYYFFVDDERVLFLPKAVKKVLKKDGADEALKLSADALEQLDTFDEENIEKALRGVAERMEKGFGKVAQPVRVAVTGTNQSAELFATLIVLGQERAVNRIRRALELRERDAFPMVEEQSDG
ncbi:MAG: hypothetical protein U5N86_08560 [Planctomycetota bacterium]|nr:hypothetical protein [Planctomycetota bacterium]